MGEREGTELQYLRHYYEKEGSQLIVLYGQKNMGMADLLEEFCRGRNAFRYRARSCSERQQLFLWGDELREEEPGLAEEPGFSELFDAIIRRRSKKKVVVIEEFQHIVRQSEDFMPQLVAFVHNAWNNQPVMILLCSTAIGWVENSMIGRIGEAAYEISGFIKLKEHSFTELLQRFPTASRRQQIETYAVLGGFPELWMHFEKSLGLKENICRHILRRGSYLHEEALRLVAEELREPGVYHTILTALASGRQKLNDLYLYTGFSRAKISVYLKNLMELELVEKVFSYDTAGRENAQKGVYRIRNRFVYFYFHYLYPHMSRLLQMEPELFYDTYIAPDFDNFAASCFRQVCREYMEMQNERAALPFVYTKAGEWVGKAGNIDLAAQDEAGHTLICLCNWEKPYMPYEDYEWLVFCAGKAKLEADHIYLFSASRFDERLAMEAEENKKLRLMDLNAL